MQKFGEVKFSKDRVKIQIWGKPVIFFSCAMSVHNEILLYRTYMYTSLVPRPHPKIGKGPGHTCKLSRMC